MNSLAKLVLFIWVALTIATAAISGVLVSLLLLIALAFGVRQWCISSLTRRYTTAHEQEIAIISNRILQIRMNAAQAKEAYDLARTLLPRNPTPAQLQVLERRRLELYKPANSQLIAEQLQGHLDSKVKGLAGAQLENEIRMSANLLGFGTFFVPVVPLVIVAVDWWQSRRVLSG
jgi:hypothetical protein